jgi:hypothetical protein
MVSPTRSAASAASAVEAMYAIIDLAIVSCHQGWDKPRSPVKTRFFGLDGHAAIRPALVRVEGASSILRWTPSSRHWIALPPPR